MTLKEIAKLAGVSTATVSYVLNNSPKVGEETRRRVQKIILETGYCSNQLARSLRSSRSGLVGVMVEDIQVKHMPMIIDGINRVADERGVQIILSNLRLMSKIDTRFSDISDYRLDIERAVSTLKMMRVDGVIYIGMHDRTIPHIFRENDIPQVYCHCYTEGEGSFVCYDNTKAGYDLANRFLALGHRRIAIIAGREDSEPSMLRLKGIRKAYEEMAEDLPEPAIYYGKWNYEEARDIARELLSSAERPTAIIALNDEMAIGVRDAAMERQIAVPEELSISGFDNADVVQYIVPRIMTVDRPLDRMGGRAMEILLDKIEQKTEENISVMLPCTLIEGASVAPA